MEPQQNNQNLKHKVLSRLEADDVSPTSKWYWRSIELSVWVMWGLSVLFGALSVAILMYASHHMRYALFEATHESPLHFWVEVTPYLWVITFALMAAAAIINFRHTRRGYRYQITHVLLSSLLFSVAGGVVLNAAGAGGYVDSKLGQTMPMYESREEFEIRYWQRPAEGRIVAELLEVLASSSEIAVRDIAGKEWRIETRELRPDDTRRLLSGDQVRILGMSSTTMETLLYACGVFDWVFDKPMSIDDLKKERRAFIEDMLLHRERAERAKEIAEGELLATMPMFCPKLPMLRKIGS